MSMSRPPPLSRSNSSSAPLSSPAITDIQSAPSLSSGLHDDYFQRRLQQPIQLPPLAIPQSAARPDPGRTITHSPTPPNLPVPQPSQSSHLAPRSQPRPYPAAPLDKLLSPQPNTPPRSDYAYSPLRSPPRSAIENKPHTRHSSESYPPVDPRSHIRHTSEQYAHDHASRAVRHEYPYASPIEPPRSGYTAFPSPASSYAPNYYPQHHSSRSSLSGGPPPPPPVINAPQSYPSQTSSPYSEIPPQSSLQRSYASSSSHPPPPPIEKRYDQAIQQRTRQVHEAQQPPESNLKYILKVRQQPIAARACGFGERDRRVIDPPPIIQLEVRDQKDNPVDLDELRYSLNVLHCTLWNAEGTCEETALVQPDRRTTRRLMGQLVASPSVAKDEHDMEGCFFCFPDLSCRTHGKYRLRFVLMRIDPMNLHVGGWSPILTDVLSDVFTVYTAKDFPGMRPSSALTRALKLQGCNIQVKKGNEKALARKRQLEASEEEEEDDQGSGKGKKARSD